MAMIPSQRDAVRMVVQALQERTPDVYRILHAGGSLAGFADLYAAAMIERMHELNDPGPALRSGAEYPERVKQIAEIRSRVVEQVLAEMLSTESLRAAEPGLSADE